MKTFLKTGCIICALFLLGTLFYEWIYPDIFITASARADEGPIEFLPTDAPVVALTFDTVSESDTTSQILDILETNQVPATFFITGAWADAHPEDVKQIAEAGHILGSSGENHKNMVRLSDAECEHELAALHQKIKDLTGLDMTFFRPPYGASTPRLIHLVKSCGYTAIGWSCDSMDWKDYDSEAIINAVCRNSQLKSGAIIRMHLGTENTPEALKAIILKLKERGYDFVPLSEVL